MNIIITGAGRGIGFETVKRLSVNPDHTIIAIARDIQLLTKLKFGAAHLNNLYPVSFDLAKGSISKQLLPQIYKKFLAVDILINNAGTLVNKPLQEITDNDLEYVFNVNVLSMFRMIRDLLPMLKNKSRKSHIVNISSIGGVQGSIKFRGLSAYSSSKGAVSILTECLAEELKEHNISVNCIALGAVQTEMFQEAFPGCQAPVLAAQMAEFIANFALTGHQFFNGKIIPASLSTP